MNPFLSYSKKSLLLLAAGLIGIAALVYYNGTHGVYLFDTSIVYYYAYLLTKGYIPFRDFFTPLLPFPGLLQAFFYKLFGYCYLAGVYAALTVTVIQFAAIYHLLTKMKVRENSTFFYSFLICLASLPVYGTIYYNHLMIAFVSIYATLCIYIYRDVISRKYGEEQEIKAPEEVRDVKEVRENRDVKDRKNVKPAAITTKERVEIKAGSAATIAKPAAAGKENWAFIWQYILIAIVFMIKIQLGAVMLGTTFLIDLFFKLKFTGGNMVSYLKFAIFRGLAFLLPLAFVIMYTKADVAEYLAFIKNLSMAKTLSYDRIKGFFALPYYIDTPMAFSPTVLYVIFLLYFYQNLRKPFTPKSFVPLFAITNMYIICLIIILNSTETLALLTPVMLVILLAMDVFLFHDDSNRNFHLVLKPALFFLLFGFSFIYSIFSFRKSVSETTSAGYAMTYENINSYTFDESAPKLYKFFNKIGVNEGQYNNFLAMDSVISKNLTKKIFFGPELEMFNVVYETQPLKPWPVWVHPGLTVTETDYQKMERVLANSNLDFIVLSRARVGFFTKPMIDFLNKNYQVVPTSSTWILILKKNTL